MDQKLFDRLATAMAAAEIFDTQVDQVVENMINVGGMPATIANAWRTAFMEVFTVDTFNDVFKKELAKRFSSKELELVAEFFESGVGARWAAENGAMLVAMNEQVQKIVKKRLPLVQKIFERQLAMLDRLEN